MEVNMTNQPDDLEAVRTLVATLQTFDEKDQARIIRWACEKLGLSVSFGTTFPQLPPAPSTPTFTNPPSDTQHGTRNMDIKTFVQEKNPPNDVQFAATVAYYHRFEAPESERKDSITSNDLQEACRKANRKRLSDPGNTLRNAHKLGLLDKGSEQGNYSINSVGENLVAMTLPQQTSTAVVPRPRKPKSKTPDKKTKK
jgi:hypothetical protein